MADTIKKKKSGNNFIMKIVKFFKQLKLEMKKVVWPTKDQLVSSTISVIVFCLIIGAIITALDFIFGNLIITQLLGL